MRSFLAVLVLILSFGVASAAEPKTREKNTKIDEAVAKALEFLASTQTADGAWTTGGELRGRMRFDGGKHPAITSLAVMAFLSAGYVPGEGKYSKNIEDGIRWVMKSQQPNGLIASNASQELYHHGISTLMLAEVAGMTEGDLNKDVRKALEKAVALILKAQRTAGTGTAAGGWRYQVLTRDSDMSVTGWQIMALRAARNVGCDVPPEAIERAVAYIKRCQDRASGGFDYMPGAQLTVACTGTGILALELCGKEHHKSSEVLKAGAFLIRSTNLPHWNSRFFSYTIYYGAQATFQLGGNYWSTYRPHLHQLLLRYQNSNGSWFPSGGESVYGPNYSTAMAVLALTVEYRFLPIYQRSEEPTDKDR
jgi:prenyltransferase beta subunit